MRVRRRDGHSHLQRDKACRRDFRTEGLCERERADAPRRLCAFHQAFQSYRTSQNTSPCAGAHSPAAARSQAASASATHSSERRPFPTSTSVPTMLRTMECKNELPTTFTTIKFSPKSSSCANETSMRLRHVGLPTADDARQKLLKSCSPIRQREARCIASTSIPAAAPGTNHEYSCMKTGGTSPTARK